MEGKSLCKTFRLNEQGTHLAYIEFKASGERSIPDQLNKLLWPLTPSHRVAPTVSEDWAPWTILLLISGIWSQQAVPIAAVCFVCASTCVAFATISGEIWIYFFNGSGYIYVTVTFFKSRVSSFFNFFRVAKKFNNLIIFSWTHLTQFHTVQQFLFRFVFYAVCLMWNSLSYVAVAIFTWPYHVRIATSFFNCLLTSAFGEVEEIAVLFLGTPLTSLSKIKRTLQLKTIIQISVYKHSIKIY